MSVQDEIKKVVESNKVVVFMKGTPEMPQCGFSAQAIRCLQESGAQVTGVNVLSDPAIRQGIKDFTHWPTIPQIFINGKFIGGCDIVTEMFERGELVEAIKEGEKVA